MSQNNVKDASKMSEHNKYEDDIVAVAISNTRRMCMYGDLGWKDYLIFLDKELGLLLED